MIIRKKLEKLSKISEKGWKLLVALLDALKRFVSSTRRIIYLSILDDL